MVGSHAYGAPVIDEIDNARLQSLDLVAREFYLIVSRIEPENHLLEMVKGFQESGSGRELVVVGGNPYRTEYVRAVERACKEASGRIRTLGSIWDQDLLNDLYGGCLAYFHGHSVGGTNPSLLRAMGAGACVVAHDNVFNREVLGPSGMYFIAPSDVGSWVNRVERGEIDHIAIGGSNRKRVEESYKWDDVACSYDLLCRKVVEGDGSTL